MLVSALRCLLIEANVGVFSGQAERRSILADLANSGNELRFVASHYKLENALAKDIELLSEVRNEILHPAHRPAGTLHGTPEYLAELRTRDLLQSTGRDDDYIWIEQLQSHGLFRWAFHVARAVAEVILLEHKSLKFGLAYLASYDRTSQIDGEVFGSSAGPAA